MSRQIADNAVFFVGDMPITHRSSGYRESTMWPNRQPFMIDTAARYHQKAYSPEDEDRETL